MRGYENVGVRRSSSRREWPFSNCGSRFAIVGVCYLRTRQDLAGSRIVSNMEGRLEVHVQGA
jgi:hypothetical protein